MARKDVVEQQSSIDPGAAPAGQGPAHSEGPATPPPEPPLPAQGGSYRYDPDSNSYVLVERTQPR